MNETDLRQLLSDKAEELTPSTPFPAARLRARRRRGAGLVALAASMSMLLGGVVVAGGRGQGEGTPVRPRAARNLVPVDLAGYYEEDESPRSRDEVQAHVDCMREQGFDLPDPVRTDDGWMVYVEDPDALGVGGPEWREAAFVTCRPAPPEGGGDLYMGSGPAAAIGDFRDCMRAQGFSLPEPRLEDGTWIFDGDGLPFGDEAWARALFVTCWPAGPTDRR